MTDVLPVVAIVAAAAICPLMMWRNARRGRPAACCVPARRGDEAPSVEELRRRLAALDAQIAWHDAGDASRVAQAGRDS